MPTDLPDFEDITLKALNEILTQEGNAEPARPRLGASGVGHPCERKSWLSFRWAMDRHIEAKGIRAIRSGHRGEAEMIEDIRKLAAKGVKLWEVDPDTGRQIGFEDLGGHFGGSCDGVVEGLLQAPKTPHVWESKVCNEKKFAQLQKLVREKGEKNALEAWDIVYYAQAQLYMHYLQLERHWLTCATPGLRDVTSVRTDYDFEFAVRMQVKAARIIFSARPPAKLSEDPSWYECKWCDFHDLCHGQSFAGVNCRTCMHSTALTAEQGGGWRCEKHEKAISVDEQREGCSAHLYLPDLVPGTMVETAEDERSITYALHGGETWADGPK